MELIQKSIHMDQVKCASAAQITIEDDINITDAKPDVFQLVMEKGNVDIDEVRAVEDHVHIRGTLKFTVLYISEEEVNRPACMEGSLSFSETVYMDGVSAGDVVLVRPVLEDLSVGMINSRKLSVQALAELFLSVELQQETMAAVGVEDAQDVEVQKKIMPALDLAISKKDIFRIREEVELPGGMPNIFSLLWQNCRLRGITFHLMDGKMSLQGEIEFFFLYEGEGEERPVLWHSAVLPVNGVVECQGMREGMLENIRCRMGHQEIEVKADADGEERRIALDLVLDLDMKLYEDIQVEMISDLYSVSREVKVVTQEGRCKQLLTKNTGKTNVSGRFKVEAGLPRMQQVGGSFGEIQVGSVEPCAEGIRVDGILQVRALYASQDAELPVYGIRGTIPYSYVLEVPGWDADCQYEMEPSLEQLSVTMLDGDEADVKAALSFSCLAFRVHEEPMVTDVQVSALDPEKLSSLPGIVAYIVRDDDTLWEIGKKYYVPVARMKEMNDLQSEEVKPGDKLLVVKGF